MTPERLLEIKYTANAAELPDDAYVSDLKAKLRECVIDIEQSAMEEMFPIQDGPAVLGFADLEIRRFFGGLKWIALRVDHEQLRRFAPDLSA